MCSHDWADRVATLRDRASSAIDSEDFEHASQLINEAFAVFDADGDKDHLVFASTLCVAADLAFIAGEVESAASLYKRAEAVARQHGTLAHALVAKALFGLAESDVARGWIQRAQERYKEALQLLRSSDHPDAHIGIAHVEAALRELPT